VEQRFRPGRVGPSGGGGPHIARPVVIRPVVIRPVVPGPVFSVVACGHAFHPEAGLVLQAVVVAAQGVQVALARRALGEPAPVIEVTPLCGYPASGEGAPLVADPDVAVQRASRPVALLGAGGVRAETDQVAVLIGQATAPGAVAREVAGHLGHDRPVAGQVARCLVLAQQRRGREREDDRAAGLGRPGRWRPGGSAPAGDAGSGPDEVDQGVGAALVGGAGIARCPRGRGDSLHQAHHLDPLRGRQEGPDLAHPLRRGQALHPAAGDRAAGRLGGAVGVGRDHRSFQGPAQCRHVRGGRDREALRLHPGRGLRANTTTRRVFLMRTPNIVFSIRIRRRAWAGVPG
jgi:hypothetical protein